jgi:hypothetical protein
MTHFRQFQFFSLLILFFTSLNVNAGLVELGVSGNYRRTYVTKDNYSQSESTTGSLGYYFWEMSALELSYTNGRSTSVTDAYTAVADFELIGLDLVFSLASREAAFRPYLKGGVAHQKKKIYYVQKGFPVVTVSSEGASPSAGLGFLIRLSSAFSLKVGVDAWSSPVDKDSKEPTTYDLSGRAGITWGF